MMRLRKIAGTLFLFVCLISSIFFAGVPSAQAIASVKQTKVRVGFFEAEGYHIMDSDGVMSGYGYDYLQMMLRYNDWSYEYEGYDKDWGDMLGMLDSGKIDMVTLADKTTERLKKYVYSKEPVGTSSTIMTMRDDNESITIGDYKTYGDKRIGLVEGSSHNAGFEKYAKKKGFRYTPVYYHDISKLLADLADGKNIDIAVTSNMRKIENEIILDEFDATNYYAIVKKGNEALIQDVDNAMRQLDVYSKDWRTTLYEKYYSNTNSMAISLSVAERQYINDLKQTKGIVKAAMNPELKPYSYFENGEAKGIAADIFKEIMKRLDIPYEIVESKNRDEYKKQLSTKAVDIDLTAYSDFSIAQKYNLEETDSYMTTSLAMVYRNNSVISGSAMSVATVDDPTEFYGYNSELIYPYKHANYGSLEECFDAVRKGSQDVTFAYVYMAEQAVASDYTNQLEYSILQNTSFGLSLGVIGQEDHRLLSILNKGVGSIDNDTTDRIMLENSAIVQNEGGIMKLVYSHPYVAIGVVALILLIIFIMLLLIVRAQNQKQKLLSSYEFERFVGYVCESYDHIEEIDLVNRKKKLYQMDQDKLTITQEDYIPYDREYFEGRVAPEDLTLMVEIFSEMEIRNMWEYDIKENFFECRIKDEDGKLRWYSYVIKAIPVDQLHPKNYILFKKDMQQIREAEEEQKQALKIALENAQKANTAKGAFVSKVSHEIRTPLNAIIGYLNIAQEKLNRQEQLEHCLRNCKNASRHLLDLINDVLDLSAIENNKLQIANTKFDFKEVLTDICNVYYSQAEQKNVVFHVDIHGLTEEKMMGDSLRTKQILMNLLSNAIKFTPEGGMVNLMVEQVKQESDKVHISFRVKDTGIGMDQDYMERLFHPFEQEDAEIAKKYGGSGLGLSITKNLVDLLEGSISVESSKNVGTEFTVVLEFGRCEQNEDEKNVVFPDVRVLIACSHKDSADYMKSLLKRCGVKADIAETKDKVLKRIAGRKGGSYEYKLCLVDDTETDFDGRDVCIAIIDQDPQEHPEIVPITYDIDQIKEAAYGLGIRKMIEKPLFQSSMVDLLMDLYGVENTKKAQPVTTEVLRGMHVLLAEDNEMNMEIAVHILKKAGMEITMARDGIEARDKFVQEKPGTFQAILMDIQMPRMDGYEATRQIRESDHEEAKSIPIIALTANAFVEDISKALNAGMNEHISKPVDDKKLYTVLQNILKED